jgi:hypothetical protein
MGTRLHPGTNGRGFALITHLPIAPRFLPLCDLITYYRETLTFTFTRQTPKKYRSISSSQESEFKENVFNIVARPRHVYFKHLV